MKHSDNLLSRNNSLILRGVAILFIMLHNFLHLEQYGFTGENEMSFSGDKAVGFFNAVWNGSNVIAEFLSHLGWIGVPVFVFLTGYGIALTPAPLTCGYKLTYIKKSYFKLLALMFPAVLFFAAIDVLNGNIWPDLVKRFSYLTMLVNFVYPFVSCKPGVYWYFGLTFQFYLLWAFLGNRMKGKCLLIWSVVLLLALLGFSALAPSNAMSIFRHCFTGWFPVFAIGVWMGLRNNKEDLKPKHIWIELLFFVALLGLILLLSNWVVTWIFIPIVALAWFIVIGLLLMRTRYLSEMFRWIGKYSACIFVCHPIARFITHYVEFRFNTNQNTSLLIIVCVYIAITVIIALVYSVIYRWLNIRLVGRKA